MSLTKGEAVRKRRATSESTVEHKNDAKETTAPSTSKFNHLQKLSTNDLRGLRHMMQLLFDMSVDGLELMSKAAVPEITAIILSGYHLIDHGMGVKPDHPTLLVEYLQVYPETLLVPVFTALQNLRGTSSDILFEQTAQMYLKVVDLLKAQQADDGRVFLMNMDHVIRPLRQYGLRLSQIAHLTTPENVQMDVQKHEVVTDGTLFARTAVPLTTLMVQHAQQWSTIYHTAANALLKAAHTHVLQILSHHGETTSLSTATSDTVDQETPTTSSIATASTVASAKRQRRESKQETK